MKTKLLFLIILSLIGNTGISDAQNHALDFDGTNDYAKITTPLGTQLNNFTIETWLYVRGTFSYNAIINGNGWDKGTTHFQINSDGKLELAINGIAPEWPRSTTALKPDRWYHVAVTYDANAKQVKFYINGALDNTVALTTTLAINLTASTIGAWEGGPNLFLRYFNGKLDEMQVWNTTRTADEISENMFKMLAGNETGLIAYYNFDQSTGTNLPDKTTGGTHNGALYNFALTGNTSNWVTSTTITPTINAISNVSATGFTVNWQAVPNATKYRIDISEMPDFNVLLINDIDAGNGTSLSVPLNLTVGKNYYCRMRFEISNYVSPSSETTIFAIPQPMIAPGNALDFDGTNDNVKINSPLAENLNNFTIETWLNTRNPFTYSALINGDGWDNGTTHFQINAAGKLELALNGVAPQWPTSVATLKSNRWYHVAVTYDASSKQVKLYINGELDNTVTLTSAVSANLAACTIGAWKEGAGNISRFFNGRLDEMRIWNTTRTATEISENMYKQLQGNETGLLAYYNFNSTIGTNLADFSGKGKDGTLNSFTLVGTTSNWVTSTAMTPFTLLATQVSTTGFTANWKAIPNAARYRLDVSDNPDFSTLLIDNMDVGNGTSFTVTKNLTAGKTYYYRLRAQVGTWISTSSVGQVFAFFAAVTAPGNALAFDGVDDFVDGTCPVLNDFTIEFWINTTQSGSVNDFSDKAVGLIDASSANIYSVTQTDFRILLTSNKVGFILRKLNTNNLVSFVGVCSDGKWHHIAISRTNGMLYFYLDGVLDQQRTFSADPLVSVNNIRLGKLLYCSSETPTFNGKMDEVRIWNRALSSSEIIAGMYKQVPSDTEGLVVYYPFNQSAGTNLPNNAVGMAGNGTLNNFTATSGWIESLAMGVPVPKPATDITASSLKLNWGSPQIGIVEKYIVQLSDNSNFDPILNTVDAGTELSATITNLKSNTKYFYRIQAKRTVVTGDGAYSPVRSATTLNNTAVEEVKENHVIIYPNPVTNGFTIETDETPAVLTIHTITGSLVKSQTVSGKAYVDVSTVKAGAYIVKVNGKIAKLVKK